MKQLCKALAFLLIVALLLAGMGQVVAVSEEPVQEVQDTRDNPLVPARPRKSNAPAKRSPESLPSYYNSADLGYITPVRDQNPYGTCWAHSVIACCEANMIKNKISVNGSTATTALDLSELHLSFYTYSDARDAMGLLDGCGSYVSDNFLDHGGNSKMSTYCLMRWNGLADESVDALKYSGASKAWQITPDLAYGANVAHLRGSYWVRATQIDQVKQGIMKFGAGTISYNHDFQYQNDNGSYYSPVSGVLNHAVTIVGWDDNYSRYNFTVDPGSDGAWIIKNSWSTYFGDEGYCYISYYDQSVAWGYDDVCFFEVDPVNRYDRNYQYDGSCNDVSSYSLSSAPYGDKVCNVFTAQSDELLEAVAINPVYDWSTYRLEIFLNPAPNTPDSGTLVYSLERDVDIAGYYTIDLDTPVPLNAGDTFSVVITNVGYETLCIGVDMDWCTTFDNNESVNHVHRPNSGTSYAWSAYSGWTDMSEVESFRIKAFTTYRLNETGFRDVSSKAWYFDFVLYAVKNGLMNGMEPMYFVPETTMSRAMLVTVLWRYAGSPASSFDHGFTDLTAGWYTEAVAWAAEHGVVNGMDETSFAPDLGITREQMAAILFRFANQAGLNTDGRGNLGTFPDGAKISPWAEDAMAWCVAEGIIGGSDGYLLPQGNATRAQVATILYRYCELVAK